MNELKKIIGIVVGGVFGVIVLFYLYLLVTA